MRWQHLSGLDAAFLYAETPTAPLHVMGLLVLESDGDPGADDYHRVRDHVARRLPSLPLLRRRLLEVPLSLGRPVWVEVGDVDLDSHVRRLALPAPGGTRELADCVGRLAEAPLQRDRPLWELVVIEGVSRGRVALVAKIHHAAADGVGAAGVLAGLLDGKPHPAAAVGEDGRGTGGRAPSKFQLVAGALAELGSQPVRAARQVLRSGRLGARLILSGAPPPSWAPRTQLNGPISNRRTVATGRVSLADVKAVKNRFGATVNHVVLAACAGALRQYLGSHGGVPNGPLVAAVPMARGTRMRDGCGNAISVVRVALPVHVGDALARLRACREASQKALKRHDALDLGQQISAWADLLTPPLLVGAARLYSNLGLADRHPPLHNVVISNVPGPGTPLYCAGSRVVACHPFGPIFDGFALNLTVLSYAGSIGIGAIACPRLVPELESIVAGFQTCVQELQRLAEAASAPARRRSSASPSSESKPLGRPAIGHGAARHAAETAAP